MQILALYPWWASSHGPPSCEAPQQLTIHVYHFLQHFMLHAVKNDTHAYYLSVIVKDKLP